MQGAPQDAYLREMAKKCRLLAGELYNESAAASLRKLAEEYAEAANAAERRNELLFDPAADRMTTDDEKSEAPPRARPRLPEPIQERRNWRR